VAHNCRQAPNCPGFGYALYETPNSWAKDNAEKSNLFFMTVHHPTESIPAEQSYQAYGLSQSQ
jgi:hypothetical protein